MTGPRQIRKSPSHWLGLGAVALVATVMACGPVSYEIPIETPIQPKLDVTAFQRVLIAGFVAGGTEDVDTNQETVRLLRSQLRSKSSLRVIDADPMPLMDIAQEQGRSGGPDGAVVREPVVQVANTDKNAQSASLPAKIREERISSPTSVCSPTPLTGSESARNIRTRSSSQARSSSRRSLAPGSSRAMSNSTTSTVDAV